MTVQEYIDALTADGWQAEALDAGDPVDKEHPIRLTRDGFVVQVLQGPHYRSKHISGYGPDRLAVDLPEPYSWDSLMANLHRCYKCGQMADETVRLGFAGRVCPECRKRWAPKVEFRGWAD